MTPTLEQLEPRDMVTCAMFDGYAPLNPDGDYACQIHPRELWRVPRYPAHAAVDVRFELRHDDGGQPGTFYNDSPVRVGDVFWVEVLLQKNDPGISGLWGMDLKLTSDSGALRLLSDLTGDDSDLFNPSLPGGDAKAFSDAAGSGVHLTPYCMPGIAGAGFPIATVGPELSAHLQLEAVSTGEVKFQVRGSVGGHPGGTYTEANSMLWVEPLRLSVVPRADINGDGLVTPLDALVAINSINRGDDIYTPSDVLGVIREVA